MNKLKPINVKQYEFKQSPYPQADKLPFRSIIVSASQGVLKIYRTALKGYTSYHQQLILMEPTKKS